MTSALPMVERSRSGLAVETIVSADRLAALAPAWEHLFRRVPSASPFQSPAWLLPWWRRFAPGDLSTLAVWRGDDLVGLAALYAERGEAADRLLPVGISLSDYQDILVDPAVRDDALARLSAALAAAPPRVARLDLGDLPAAALALALPAPPGWSRHEDPHEACPVLDLSPWPGCVPALRRRKWRMAAHRAERAGGCRISPLADTGPQAFLDALFALHDARWQSRGKEGVLADPRVRAFHREALPGLAAAGLADAALLHVGGRLAGAYYGLRRATEFHAYLGGFDPVFHREGPGTLLLGAALERAVAAGARRFHFLRGREAYKYDWGARDTWTRRLSLVRGAP